MDWQGRERRATVRPSRPSPAGTLIASGWPAAAHRTEIPGREPRVRRLDIEAELVDSATGKQIMAGVSNSLMGADRKRTVARWVERLRMRLEEVHGMTPSATRAEALSRSASFPRTATSRPAGRRH